MEKTDNKLEGKVIFWAVLGPFITLLTLFVSITKGASYGVPLAFVTVVGIPVCWRWRMRGLLLSMLALTTVLLLSFSDIPLEHRFWELGLAMALALSLVVTALSFEEVELLIGQLQRELQGRLESLWRLDEKLKNVQERWQYDREDFSVRLKLLQQELEEKQGLIQAKDNATQVAQADLQRISEQKQALKAELLQEQQFNMALKCDLAEANSTASDLLTPVDHENIRQIQELEKALLASKRETESLEQRVQDLLKEQPQVQPVEQVPAPAPSTEAVEEKERELKRAQGLYRQLREQFEDKDRVLHQTRVALFQKEGELMEMQRQYDEAEKAGFLSAEKQLQKAVDKLEQRCTSKDAEIEELNELVSSLMDEVHLAKASASRE